MVGGQRWDALIFTVGPEICKLSQAGMPNAAEKIRRFGSN